MSCSLLPLDKLSEINQFIKKPSDDNDLKTKNKLIRKLLTTSAEELGIKLILRKK